MVVFVVMIFTVKIQKANQEKEKAQGRSPEEPRNKLYRVLPEWNQTGCTSSPPTNYGNT